MKRIKYLILLLFAMPFVACEKKVVNPNVVTNNEINYGNIYTVAGDGDFGYSGDGGVSTAAELGAPIAVAFDQSGNFYIADNDNNCIRKVNNSGIISTFAGIGMGFGPGTGSYSGDGGPATAAELSSPNGVAVDASGNIYIADLFNGRIRKVNTSGIISTFAGGGNSGLGDGGTATAAEIFYAINVALDNKGNIFIVDGNSRIRKVNTAGIISTVAGNGAPGGYGGDGGPATATELNNPSSVAIDNLGDIYISDCGNQRIRKVNTNGIISTIAGNGLYGYNGDGGPATSAELNNPSGIIVDNNNNVFFADEVNRRIREINTSGIISTLAGNGTLGYTGDGGLAINAELGSPYGLAFDSFNNIYIADFGTQTVRKVDKI